MGEPREGLHETGTFLHKTGQEWAAADSTTASIAAAPVEARGHAGEAAEHSRHVLLMRKTALKRNVREALLVFAK